MDLRKLYYLSFGLGSKRLGFMGTSLGVQIYFSLYSMIFLLFHFNSPPSQMG